MASLDLESPRSTPAPTTVAAVPPLSSSLPPVPVAEIVQERIDNPLEWIRNAEGGCVSAADFCSLLNWPREELSRRNLVSLPNPRNIHERLYPQWQVMDGKLLPGLELVVAALREQTTIDSVQISFFLVKNLRVRDAPLNALRNGREWDVVRAAEGFLSRRVL